MNPPAQTEPKDMKDHEKDGTDVLNKSKDDKSSELGDNSERFQIRSSNAPNAQVVSAFATREEADRAMVELRTKMQEAHQQLAALPHSPIIVDSGVRTKKSEARHEANDAAKTLEQKERERRRASGVAPEHDTGTQPLGEDGQPLIEGSGVSDTSRVPDGRAASSVEAAYEPPAGAFGGTGQSNL